MPTPTHLLTPLHLAVLDPWESITWALSKRDAAPLGDPHTPATPAFHLHHTIEVLRLHARTVISHIDPANIDRIPHPDDVPIPAPTDNAPTPLTPESALAELKHLLEVFSNWLESQPPRVLDISFTHGDRTLTLEDFIHMMARHIVWHAAAMYYRSKPPSDADPSR